MYESGSYQLEAVYYKFSQGLQLLRSGDYQAAVQVFSVAITLDPEHPASYLRRAEAYRNPGLEEQANADLERAKFLMAAARQVTTEKGSGGGAVVGAIGGGIVGGLIGGVGALYGGLFLLEWFCWTGWCYVFFGFPGGIVGGVIGGGIGEAIHRRLFRPRVEPSGEVSGSFGWFASGYLGRCGRLRFLMMILVILA